MVQGAWLAHVVIDKVVWEKGGVGEALSRACRVIRGLRGPHAHAVFVIDRPATFGRAAGTDVQILDQRISRQHARITITAAGNIVLIDLESRNGTFVNGDRVSRCILSPGDHIDLGAAEYIFEHCPRRAATSDVFSSKSMTRDTLGPTLVGAPRAEIQSRPTAEVDTRRADSDAGPMERPTVNVPVPRDDEPGTEEEASAAVRRATETYLQALDLPESTALPKDWTDLRKKEPPTRRHTPTVHAPRDPVLLSDVEGLGAENPAPDTEALDPRRFPRNIPVSHRGHRPPQSEAENLTKGPAYQAVNAVMRHLALKVREQAGHALSMHERGQLRQLERALREQRKEMQGQRRWLRLACKLEANLGESQQSAVLHDISAGGLCIRGSHLPLSQGEELQVRVRLGTDSLARIAIFSIRVVWTDTLGGSFGGAFAGGARWELANRA